MEDNCIELKREDVIPPSKFHKEIEDKIIGEVEANDCYVKFDLLGLWVLRQIVLDYYEKGKHDALSKQSEGDEKNGN